MAEIDEAVALELARKPPDEEYVSIPFRHRELVRVAEEEARREAKAARVCGQVSVSYPPLGWERYGGQQPRDDWFEAVYGMSERELVEAHNAAAREYKRLLKKPWARRRRREALEQFIRLHARITVAHGLTTSWC